MESKIPKKISTGQVAMIVTKRDDVYMQQGIVESAQIILDSTNSITG